MTIHDFISTAWSDHGEHAASVADRLVASLHLITEPAHIAPYAALVTHVYGEHLARWDDGAALLGAMRRLPAFDASEAAERPLRRGSAVLRCTAEALAAHADQEGAREVKLPAALSAQDQADVLASTSAALAGRRAFGAAVQIYTQALAIADQGLSAQSPALRAMAIGGNNLAAALEEHTGRNAAERAGMLMAAEAGLKYWKLAGTWLEEERAELRLSQCRLAAGLAVDAIASAERCLAICAAQDAPAIERFFGQAALASAQKAADRGADFEASRAKADALFAQIPAEERAWCAGTLAQLRASPPAA